MEVKEVKLDIFCRGIDCFKQEVRLHPEQHPEITEALERYVHKNVKRLRLLIEAPEIAEAAQLINLKEGTLLIYYRFLDWWGKEGHLIALFSDGAYSSVPVQPGDVGLVKKEVLAILNSLPPLTTKN